MEKSLLSILTAEERLLEKIESANLAADHYLRWRDIIAAYPTECAAKEADIAHYNGLVANCRQSADEYRQQLDAVRDELCAYISELFK